MKSHLIILYSLLLTPQATFSTHLNIEIHFYLSYGSLTCPNSPSMNEFIATCTSVENNTFLMCIHVDYFLFPIMTELKVKTVSLF